MSSEPFLNGLAQHIKQRIEGGRGGVISVKPRRICQGNRRCVKMVNLVMTGLVERGLARQHKRGVYLIKRRTAKAVLSALKRWPMPATAATATGAKKTRRRARRKA